MGSLGVLREFVITRGILYYYQDHKMNQREKMSTLDGDIWQVWLLIRFQKFLLLIWLVQYYDR